MILPDTPAQAGDVRSARRQLLALEAGDGTVEEAAYVALLTGCARAGRADLAKEWLEEMKAKVRLLQLFRGFSHLGVLEGLEVCCEGKAPALASVRLKMVMKKRGKFLDSWWLCSRYYLQAEFPLRHCACEGMVPGIRCYSAALGAASEGDVAHWLAEPWMPLEWL